MEASSCSILVVDLEATCANDGSIPPEVMEIIEIGAVWAASDGAVLDRFQSFVRPIRRPTLAPFCIGLTGITQTDIDGAPLFPAAARRLGEFASRRGEAGAVWLSWGGYDRRQIALDCARHGAENPLELPHEDAKRIFAARHQTGTRITLAAACELTKIGIEGSYHRALDDAINTARLLPWILGIRTLAEVVSTGS